MQTLIIKGSFPSRNEFENASRSHWSSGAGMKKQYTLLVQMECKKQKIKSYIEFVMIEFTFYESNKKRDPDNVISGSIKPILDGLVKANILQDDSLKYMNLSINPIEIDKLNPRIEIKFKEKEDL